MAPSSREVAATARAVLGIATRRRVFGGPRLVVLDICEACNTDCIMCDGHSALLGLDATKAPPNGMQARSSPRSCADRAMVEGFIRQCAEAGIYKVVLGESGEPTIHPHFEDLLDLTLRLGMSPLVMTNGISLDEDQARVLATKRAHYRFSLHAGDLETWLRVHPGASARHWERLSRVIRILTATGRPTVTAMYVLQKANHLNVSHMVEHAYQHGLHKMVFSPVRATGPLAQVLLTHEEEAELRSELRRGLALARRLGLETNIAQYLRTNFHVRMGQHHTSWIYRHVPCYVGWLHTYLLADGTVVPCEGSSQLMGQASQQDLMDIWRSPRYKAFRQAAISWPARGSPVEGCLCNHCSLVDANLRMHRLLRFGRLDDGLL